MSVYRIAPAFVAPENAPRRCEVCGLRVTRVGEESRVAYERLGRGDRLGAMLECLAGGSLLHGDDVGCPGPPRLELMPLWRALLELVVG